jgi:chaperonin GroEL
MFIGSSVEGLKIAYAIQENLDHEAEITVWSQGVFDLSVVSLDSLVRLLEAVDFGVFVFTPDDLLLMRGTEQRAVRDNVVFELGLFIGKLGRQRSFIVTPRGEQELHIPSDLAGLTPATYDPFRSDGNLQAALGAACNQVRRAVQNLGPIQAQTILVAPTDPREVVLKGIRLATQYIAKAIGPQGQGMAVVLKGGQQVVTRVGSRIAAGVKASGLEALGVKEVLAVAEEMDDHVGDGAKIAAILMGAMAEGGHESLAKGYLPRDVVEGMRRAVDEAQTTLRHQSTLTKSKQDVAKVAATAAQSPELGKLIVEAMDYVGKDGIITVEESIGNPRLERLEGVRFDRGYITDSFAAGSVDNKLNLEDCYVLVTTEKIDSMRPLLGLLEAVATTKRPLLVVADDVQGEALATLIVNAQRGVIRSVAVRAPGSGAKRRPILEDLAILTGASLLSPDLGISIESATLSDLGRSKRVIVDRETTTLVEGAGDPEKIEARAATIRSDLDNVQSGFEREQLQERLARLRGGVASILVGGVTYSDTLEAKYALYSALQSAYQAVATGFVPGGGIALANSAAAIKALAPQVEAEAAGLAIVVRALSAPLRALIATTRREEAATLEQIDQSPANFGVNTETSNMEDLVEAGVLDALEVVSHALKVAFAHGRQFLFADAWESPSNQDTDTAQLRAD